MKLVEALATISKGASSGGELLRVALVCGFTPLHLQTFLHAELQSRFPNHRIEIVTGTYGDVAGSLSSLVADGLEAVAVPLEWEDLDRRLGTRHLGGWGPGNLSSIHEQTRMRLSQLMILFERISKSIPVILSLPTLPLPPLFFTGAQRSGAWETALENEIFSFAAALTQHQRIRLIGAQRLQYLSPLSQRLDVKSEWTAGFPYSLLHASTVAGSMAQLIENPLPKKGLISDLDNTFWSGIIGEAGASEISWDLDHHSQGNGLYQQLLKTLAEEGVLVGVASKNDPSVIDEVLKRNDLIFDLNKAYPLDVSWGSKSAAVSRILETWNINADSVVFVDDDPLELAEVQAAHPTMTCLRFPRQHPQEIFELIVELRDLFGRDKISEEDQLRLESIRASANFVGTGDAEGFSEVLLEQAEPELTLTLKKDAEDARAFELLNKTNQFNLNGRRFTEAGWQNYLGEKDTFLLTAAYQDRFGPLGKIAVLAGRMNGEGLIVESWVMSCRAFSRRIEHQCLKSLFAAFNCETITFDYERTQRNGPVTSFLSGLMEETDTSRPRLSRQRFTEVCPRLFHRVREIKE
jgi:FkbH-like protein